MGTAVTDSNGVATLSGVTTSDTTGTPTGAVVANFAGDSNDVASSGTGDLVVSQAATTLTSVAGTAISGGTATLAATLTSSVTSKGIAGETLSFMLDGTAVGTAVTDSNGVATLSGVATSDPVGTHAGVSRSALPATPTMSPAVAPATCSSAFTRARSRTYQGRRRLGARQPWWQPSSRRTPRPSRSTVSFKLDGTDVGTAVTDSNGVATLSGVATTDPAGTHTGAVVASFAGDVNNGPSTGTGDLVVSQAATTLGSVSGTASFGGPATLVATLTSSVTSQRISGETVSFTLDGTDVGTAVTDSTGVASLSGVATSDPVGTHTGAVVASYAGGTDYLAASDATGDLVVSQAATTLGSVSGTASFGGPATLVATLTSSVTSQGISGETVSFTLDGTDVGTAVTDSTGVASLSGVATSDPVGTHTGAVVASYAGGTDYLAASDATGDLVVSQAATTLGSVSGTASFGGPATLVATLTSSVTSQGISGETVSFTLDGTDVGTAVTDSTGVASLSGVATSDPVGTHTGAVVASYAGGTDYLAASDATGDLVVS